VTQVTEVSHSALCMVSIGTNAKYGHYGHLGHCTPRPWNYATQRVAQTSAATGHRATDLERDSREC
jgi:hypothetical protein